MPDAAHLVAFAVAATTIALIPWSGDALRPRPSIGGGRDEGLRSTAGTGIGGMVHVAAAAAGLSAIIATSATAFTGRQVPRCRVLDLAGVQGAVQPRPRTRHRLQPGGTAPARSNALRQGALTEVLNPKRLCSSSPSCRSSASPRTARSSCRSSSSARSVSRSTRWWTSASPSRREDQSTAAGSAPDVASPAGRHGQHSHWPRRLRCAGRSSHLESRADSMDGPVAAALASTAQVPGVGRWVPRRSGRRAEVRWAEDDVATRSATIGA